MLTKLYANTLHVHGILNTTVNKCLPLQAALLLINFTNVRSHKQHDGLIQYSAVQHLISSLQCRLYIHIGRIKATHGLL